MKQIITCIVLLGCISAANAQTKKYAVTKTDAEWRKQLTAEQFNVTRQKGTERAYTGIYWDNHEQEFTNAFAVTRSYSARPLNLRVEPVGRVFGNRL